MLRASWRLLRPGGRLAFFTIFPAPGLSRRDYRRALSAGPRSVATRRREHREMLASAGFEEVQEYDLTAEFARVTRDLITQENLHEDDLRPAVGDELFDGRQQQLADSLVAIDEGLLRRALFLARRPVTGG